MKNHQAFTCPFCGAPYTEIIPSGTVQIKCSYCKSTVLVPPQLDGDVQRCLNHPEALCAGICNDCGKSFCGDCLFITEYLEYGQRTKGYLYICKDCMKERRLQEKKLFTASMVKNKMSELKERAKRLKSSMTTEEVEELFRRIRNRSSHYSVDPYTNIEYWRSNPNDLLKKYMKLNMSRKDAIFKIAEELWFEIKPGILLSSTMKDALSALEKEQERIRLDKIRKKKEELANDPNYLHEQLLRHYSIISTQPRRFLEYKIENLRKKGLTKEEAIKRLAVKEKIIEKGLLDAKPEAQKQSEPEKESGEIES